MAAKAVGQMAVTGETDAERDGGDVHLPLQQKPLGAAQALPDDVLAGSDTERLGEGDEQLMAGHPGQRGKVILTDALTEISVNELAQAADGGEIEFRPGSRFCGS